MIFHENRLLADDSLEISYLFFRKLENMSQNLSSAAVLIDALRVNSEMRATPRLNCNCNVCKSRWIKLSQHMVIHYDQGVHYHRY